MSSIDSLLSSAPRLGRRQLVAWLDDQAEAVAAGARAELSRIVDSALARVTGSIVAADLTELGDIPDEWSRFVQDTMGDQIAGLFLSGSATAFVGASTTGAGAARIPRTVAEAWPAVVNDNAVAFAAQATNRLAAVGESVYRMLAGQVSQAIASGAVGEELTQQLRDLSGFSEYRADTIARTESMGAFVNGDRQGVEALGVYGPVEHSWMATHDARTRESHLDAEAEGAIPIDQPFTATGMLHPHAAGPAEEVVNCRCVEVHYYPGDTRPDGSTVPEA